MSLPLVSTAPPVHVAACEGNIIKLKELKEDGLSLTELDDDKRTPLHWAASLGFAEIVHYLLTVPSDPKINNRDEGGWTAIMSAAAAGKAEGVNHHKPRKNTGGSFSVYLVSLKKSLLLFSFADAL